MAGANSNISLVGLDFDSIKSNLKKYLQSQDTFKDYNFDGSGLSVLLDVLAYNTQYNAFYLNMVANEMFLDTALQRPSVVSHAKLLNYTPRSATAPTAYINITANNVTDSSLTLPAYTTFLSEPVGDLRSHYQFVTTETSSVSTDLDNNSAIFNNIELKQGIPVNYSYTVSSTDNPSYTFELPDNSIDTDTIRVSVQKDLNNDYFDVYNPAKNFLELDGTSMVYFLDETLNGNYQISFGDGILGKKLTDGNLVQISYLITDGTNSSGANNFTLMSTVHGFTNIRIDGVVQASQGGEKESLDSIKYQAPKSYSAQNRAVTKEDYITLIQQNSKNIKFDAVNVWGGQDNDPVVYGQVFVCLKPSGALTLTATQKQALIRDVLYPISVMTVDPKIVDPDYTFIKLDINVLYDPAKTNLTASQLEEQVKMSVQMFTDMTLNTFNATFNSHMLLMSIQNTDASIITSEYDLKLQKKIYPNLTTPSTYKLYYGTELQKGMFLSGVNSSPAMKFRDTSNLSNIIDGIYLEELPSSTGSVDTISITNPGYSYQVAPTISIQGDGSGASAIAYINVDGTISSIQVTSSGNNYTSAVATITPASYDTTGQGAAAVVNLTGKYGTLRTYYNNTKNIKTIFNSNAGTIDYKSGLVTLTDFGPIQVDNPLGQLTITVKPTSSIISSTLNRLIAVDPYDPNAITVKVTVKQ